MEADLALSHLVSGVSNPFRSMPLYIWCCLPDPVNAYNFLSQQKYLICEQTTYNYDTLHKQVELTNLQLQWVCQPPHPIHFPWALDVG